MEFPKPQKLEDLAAWLKCEFRGDPSFEVRGMNEIHVVREGDLVFVDHPKYYDKALRSPASAVLINREVEAPEGKVLLISDDPFRDFNRLTERFSPFGPASGAIDPSAKTGKGTVIQPGVFIGRDVVVGEDCLIQPNAVLYPGTRIGDRVIVGANTVIGSDAFYYKKRKEGYDRLLSGGGVHIEDDVEIGASCTIDRGSTGMTRIGRGTKIDNLVMIGHDTVVGEDCLMASQVGIAGCVVVENGVTLWGQVGIASDVTIGEKATVLAQSGISKSLEGGKTYFGYPADDIRKKYREMASLRVLPEVIEKLNLK